MSFAGFNSSKLVKGRLQAALYSMRKKNRLRRADPGAGGGGSSYLGPVATGTFFPTNDYNVGGAVGYNSYSAHYATDNITSLQLVFVGTMANASGGSGFVEEHATNITDNTVTCTIEYPAGVFTRIKKSGSNNIAVNAGAFVVTDAAAIVIPKGAKFDVNTYWTKQGGGTPHVAATYDIGSNFGRIENEFTPNDQSGTKSDLGTVRTWSQAGFQIGPQAIIGTTSTRAFALIGDSRMSGVQAGVTDANKACTGEVALALYNLGHGVLNLGVGNDRAEKFLLSNTQRRALADYCSDIVLGFGANDIFSRTPAQLLADMQSIRNYWPTKPCYLYTLPPVGVASSDNGATLAGQTVSYTYPALPNYNDLLRAGPAWATRVWEIADVLESSRNSGKWRIDLGLVNGAGGVFDATHENQLGNTTIANSGAITV